MFKDGIEIESKEVGTSLVQSGAWNLKRSMELWWCRQKRGGKVCAAKVTVCHCDRSISIQNRHKWHDNWSYRPEVIQKWGVDVLRLIVFFGWKKSWFFGGGTEFVCRKSLPALEDLLGVWESANLDEARFRGCRRHHTTAGRRLGTPKKRKRYKILIHCWCDLFFFGPFFLTIASWNGRGPPNCSTWNYWIEEIEGDKFHGCSLARTLRGGLSLQWSLESEIGEGFLQKQRNLSNKGHFRQKDFLRL